MKNKVVKIKNRLVKSKSKWPIDKLVKEAMIGYQNTCGYSFDINNPVLFTEKIQWYKLFYDDPKLVNIVDKYLFKDYINQQLGEGYTIPLYGVWDSVKSLKKGWKELPSEFVLKSTLQSDGKYIKVIKNKDSENLNLLLKEVKDWFEPNNTLINSFCRAYYKAKPRVIAEKYETQIDNQLLDYKFFCFNGVPKFVYAQRDNVYGSLSKISFYNLDWTKMNVRYGDHPNCDVDKPKHLNEMIELSRKLSKGFPFVRVDFFDTDEKLYIAELTFYPGGGLTLYYPIDFNKQMGDMFILPNHF